MTDTIDPKAYALAQHFLRTSCDAPEDLKRRMTDLVALRIQQEAEGCMRALEALGAPQHKKRAA